VVSGLLVLHHLQPALKNLLLTVRSCLLRLRYHGIQHLRNQLLLTLWQLADYLELLFQS
jgi:hypothetical protein